MNSRFLRSEFKKSAAKEIYTFYRQKKFGNFDKQLKIYAAIERV